MVGLLLPTSAAGRSMPNCMKQGRTLRTKPTPRQQRVAETTRRLQDRSQSAASASPPAAAAPDGAALSSPSPAAGAGEGSVETPWLQELQEGDRERPDSAASADTDATPGLVARSNSEPCVASTAAAPAAVARPSKQQRAAYSTAPGRRGTAAGRDGASGRRAGDATVRVVNRRNQALSRAVSSVRKYKPAVVPPLSHGSTRNGGVALGETVSEFLEPLRLEHYAKGCVAQGYCFAEDLVAAAATGADEELVALFEALRIRKPEERRFRQALLDKPTKTAAQDLRGRHSATGTLQELVGELLEPLQLGRYASLMCRKGYPYCNDVTSADDGELTQLLQSLKMRPPEERRLRKHLGRPSIPEDPAKVAAHREAIAAAKAAEEEAQMEDRAAALAASAEEEVRAARRASKKKARAENKAKALKFLSAMMGNNLRNGFVKWKDAVGIEKAKRAAVTEAARAEAARKRMAHRVRRRDDLRRGVISLCGERNGERVSTYAERPGCLLGPGWGGVEERELAITLALDKLWPAMEVSGARLLAELLQQTVTSTPNSASDCSASVGGHSSGIVVESISLANNALGPFGCAALSRALVLPVCSKLSKLDLRGNHLGNDGVVALAHILWQCKSLEVLDLRDNQIGDDGAIAIAEVLPRLGNGGKGEDRCSCALRELGLGGNLITDKGAEALSRALELTVALRSVELDGNPLGTKARAALASSKRTATAMNVWLPGKGAHGGRLSTLCPECDSGGQGPVCAQHKAMAQLLLAQEAIAAQRWREATEYCEAGLAFAVPTRQPVVAALRAAQDKASIGLQQHEERIKLAVSCPLCVRGGTGSHCLDHKEMVRLSCICPDCESGGCGKLCAKHLFQHPEVCRARGFTPLQCKENGTSAAALHKIAYSEQPPHTDGLERGKASNLSQGMQVLVTERDDRNGGTADASSAQFGQIIAVGEKGRLTVLLEEERVEEDFWLSGHSNKKPRKKHGILERLQVYRFVYLLDRWRTPPKAELIPRTDTLDCV